MASHESARKRIRQTAKRTDRLRRIRSTTRTYIKKLRAAIHKNDKQGAETSLRQVISQIDRAVSKGVFHRRTGSRYIARLATQVSRISA